MLSVSLRWIDIIASWFESIIARVKWFVMLDRHYYWLVLDYCFRRGCAINALSFGWLIGHVSQPSEGIPPLCVVSFGGLFS